MVLLLYTTYISVDLAHHEIVRAKVGKGGINVLWERMGMVNLSTHDTYFQIRWSVRIHTLMLKPMRIFLTLGKLTSFLFESVKGPNGLNFYV